MKVWFETFGCRLNRAEALQREAELVGRGWILAKGAADADLIVVRGCSITARAQHDCEKTIARLKEKYPLKKIAVEGCLPRTVRGDKIPEIPLPDGNGLSPATVPTSTARAYLKVQDGCSGRCSFCIVPQFRGSPVSIPACAVVDRAKAFIDAGYREIVVTGCNLSLYMSEGKNISRLIEDLSDISPSVRIRIGSIEPVKAAEDLVDVMADRPNVCNFLHLPIQSGSDQILSMMRRPYHMKGVEKIIAKAVAKIPGIGLGCDLITGFPGESSLDFLASKRLLADFPFSTVHVFPYSERPGTDAARYSASIAKDLRKSRARELMDIAILGRRRQARKQLGKTVSFVVESSRRVHGWSAEYFKCEEDEKRPLKGLVRKELVEATVVAVRKDVLSVRISAKS